MSDLVPGVRLCCVLPVQPVVLALMEHDTYIVGTGECGELLRSRLADKSIPLLKGILQHRLRST